MIKQARFVFVSVLAAGVVLASSAAAQPPKAIDIKLGDITLRLTNIDVVTGEPKPGGGLPDKPIPVPADKLLPPDVGVWITFDYETNFKKSDAPESPSFLAVGIEIPDMKPWGYQPADIKEKSGKGSIGFVLHVGGSKPVEVNEAIKLVAFTQTNNGQQKQKVSDAAVPVKFRKDGVVILSATQFEEIQATIRKVAELEKKVQALEGKKSP